MLQAHTTHVHTGHEQLDFAKADVVLLSTLWLMFTTIFMFLNFYEFIFDLKCFQVLLRPEKIIFHKVLFKNINRRKLVEGPLN